MEISKVYLCEAETMGETMADYTCDTGMGTNFVGKRI